MYQTIFKCVTSKKGLNRFFECSCRNFWLVAAFAGKCWQVPLSASVARGMCQWVPANVPVSLGGCATECQSRPYWLWDCNTANEQTAKMARELGVQVHAYTVNLSKRLSIYETADRVRAEVGEVSILVNNAGVVAGRRAERTMLERTMLVNCHALFWVRFGRAHLLRTMENRETPPLRNIIHPDMNDVTSSPPHCPVCVCALRCDGIRAACASAGQHRVLVTAECVQVEEVTVGGGNPPHRIKRSPHR